MHNHLFDCHHRVSGACCIMGVFFRFDQRTVSTLARLAVRSIYMFLGRKITTSIFVIYIGACQSIFLHVFKVFSLLWCRHRHIYTCTVIVPPTPPPIKKSNQCVSYSSFILFISLHIPDMPPEHYVFNPLGDFFPSGFPPLGITDFFGH